VKCNDGACCALCETEDRIQCSKRARKQIFLTKRSADAPYQDQTDDLRVVRPTLYHGKWCDRKKEGGGKGGARCVLLGILGEYNISTTLGGKGIIIVFGVRSAAPT
jgi:hypothetical protein